MTVLLMTAVRADFETNTSPAYTVEHSSVGVAEIILL